MQIKAKINAISILFINREMMTGETSKNAAVEIQKQNRLVVPLKNCHLFRLLNLSSSSTTLFNR